MVSNSFVLSAKQSSKTSNFKVFFYAAGIEPPTSRMPAERSTTTLPGRGESKQSPLEECYDEMTEDGLTSTATTVNDVSIVSAQVWPRIC